MFDHIGSRVTNLDESVAFYCQTLAPLGLSLATRGDGNNIEAVCHLPRGA